MRFEPAELALLADSEEIEIETAADSGSNHRTIIWVVVDGDDAFVRSVRGRGARWFREATAASEVTVHVADRALRVHVVPAVDADSVRRASDAIATKYAGFEGTPSMLDPAVFDTTLRLEPG